MLAAVLLLLYGRAASVGRRFKNSLGTSVVLIAVVLFFVLAGALEVRHKLLSGGTPVSRSQITAPVNPGP